MPVVSGGWNLVRFYEFTDEFEDLHMLGMLENATGQAQESPIVNVIFRDEMGNEVVTDSQSLALDIVPAGGRAPFHLITFMEGHATYDLSVDATPNDYPLRTDLVVDDVEVFLEGEIYIVTGNIVNPGARLEAYVEVAVALLDEAEQTIGVGSTWILAQGLSSGQALPFRIEIDEFLDTAVGYDIVAVGG
jgi:hypothetical protein